ncbi:hypothetical protein JCM10450v2_007963 [Rhodotorula kratochvilovae]
MPPHTTVVLTLVSRGAADAPGQGSELLLFALPDRRGRGEVYRPAQLEFALQTTIESPSSSSSSPSAPAPLPVEASTRAASAASIRTGLLLDPAKDLRLVRCSKLVPWAPSTFLIAYLWRTSEAYERGLEAEFAVAQGAAPAEGEGAEQAVYREVEVRLGRGGHAWEAVEAVERDLSRMKHEHLSFAYHSVVLPPLLDDALHLSLSLRDKLSHFDLADLALNCFLQLVQARSGEGAFRGSWPAHVKPPDGKTWELPEEVVKDRLFRYWVEVVAHHFRHVSPASSPTLSALFLRLLLPLKPLALAPASSVPLASFLRSATEAVLAEGARLRLAAATLDKLGVAKVLERAATDKRAVLHVLAAGNDPAVAGMLRELVHYVTTIAAHPYGTLNPHIQALTHSAEIEWASRPNLLTLTLLESRPLCTGAVLASHLWDVSRAAREKATQLRGLATSYENPWRAHPLAAPVVADGGAEGGLQARVLRGLGVDGGQEGDGELAAQVGAMYGALDRLLASAEGGVFGRPPPAGLGGAKVNIRVAPDNAVASVLEGLRARGEGPAVVLLGVEAVLPGKGGDVSAPMGSWAMAGMAKKLGARVYVIATSDQILSSLTSPAPPPPQHDPTELLAGWAGTLAAELESLDAFALAAADKAQPGASVFTETSEVVPGRLIDGYITEKGFLSATGCDMLGRERTIAEHELYGS